MHAKYSPAYLGHPCWRPQSALPGRGSRHLVHDVPLSSGVGASNMNGALTEDDHIRVIIRVVKLSLRNAKVLTILWAMLMVHF